MGNNGYENVYTQSFWGMVAGHNCTNYAAYRLIKNGVDASYLQGQGMAWQWGGVAQAHGVAVDKTPVVGDIAWFSSTSGVGSDGHVAYVESVDPGAGTVRVSEDNYGGDFDWRDYYISNVTGFIHFGGVPTVSDGSYVSYQGNVYRIAGGAPVYVSSWAHMGGTQPTVALSDAQWNGLRAVPADGTYVTGVFPGDPLNGSVYRIAGGAPIYVSSWDHMGGGQPTVAVDLSAIEMAGQGGWWNHLNYTPADGTYIAGSGNGYASSGTVFRIAGGAPIAVANWANMPGGAQPTVQVDAAAIDNAGQVAPWGHLNYRPVNGTVLAASNLRYVTQAGIAYPSTTAQSGVQVDPNAIAKAGDGGVWDHLAAMPGYVPLDPSRVLDTRSNNGAAGPVAGWSTIHVQVAGRGGVPATGVSAVVINVTETSATSGGYVTVYPDGTTKPTASNLNYPQGDTRANLVVVKLGSGGKIALTNSSGGTVQLIGDVAGYYLAGVPAHPGVFVSLDPSRVLDTRTGNGATGPVAGWSTTHVQVAGRGGVPATGVSAVVINVTETDATAGGYVIVYPDGTTRPTASNLNYPTGDTRANLVTVTLGSNGKLAFTATSTAQLIGDVAGYYLAGTPTTPGAFVSLDPSRVLDTRASNGTPGPVAGWSTIHVQIAGRGGVPAAGVSAVVINVTETGATSGGYVTVYPDGTTRPTASNLNYPQGDTRANLVVVRLGADGKIALTNNSGGTVQLIGDVAGYYRAG